VEAFLKKQAMESAKHDLEWCLSPRRHSCRGAEILAGLVLAAGRGKGTIEKACFENRVM
jgi:hypothetical protein